MRFSEASRLAPSPWRPESDHRSSNAIQGQITTLDIPQKHAASSCGVLLDEVPLLHQYAFLTQAIQGGPAHAEVLKDRLGIHPQIGVRGCHAMRQMTPKRITNQRQTTTPSSTASQCTPFSYWRLLASSQATEKGPQRSLGVRHGVLHPEARGASPEGRLHSPPGIILATGEVRLISPP